MTRHLIKRLGHQGDGIADGPVFAARTLPGEEVSGDLDGQVLRNIRIETPSADRVRPPCRHFKACGGCQLQHATDEFVAQWKTDHVATALKAQGLAATIRPIVTSPPRTRRRVTLSARRTKKGALVGFHAPASDVIIEIPDCILLQPALLGGLDFVEALAVLGASRKSVLSVTLTACDDGLDVAVSGGKPLDKTLELALGPFAEAHRLARLAWEDEVIAIRVPPVQSFGTAQVVPPPGAFLQATRHGEAALLAAVQEATAGARQIADLFAGCGTFALPLASTAEVHAVEGDGAMLSALDHGWRHATRLKKVSTEPRDLFRRPLMPDELARYDAVVLDPPRAGAEAQVTQLAHASVPVIAYVSCNPVTFARDAAQLVAAGYALDWVQPVDQFRWSTHTELAACFTASHIRAA